MTREKGAAKIQACAESARITQIAHSRVWDGVDAALADCAEGLAVGTHFLKQDIAILRGMISARSYEKTPYHEAIVPVLQEALGVLEGLVAT